MVRNREFYLDVSEFISYLCFQRTVVESAGNETRSKVSPPFWRRLPSQNIIRTNLRSQNAASSVFSLINNHLYLIVMAKKNSAQTTEPVQKMRRLPILYPNEVGEVAIYNPNDSIRLEVRMEQESVWLSQAQMGTLFGVDRTVIVKHIKNVYECGELDEVATCAKIAQVRKEGGRSVARTQKYYNLDMILSVGYRVNSLNATYFRKWASNVLKDYLIRGYAINPRLEQLEKRVSKTEEEIAFFVKTALPPVEGIFFDGQIYDAYEFICGLIKSAKTRIVLIDNYVDDTVLTMLDKRETNVSATIYTQKITAQFQLDIAKHNAQYPAIEVKEFIKSHDRFLILDNQVYLIGASLKDLGKKWFAVALMSETAPDLLLSRL